MIRLATILLLLLAAGCAGGKPPANANDTVILSRNIAYGAPLWRTDAGRRIKGRPVLLVVHGGTQGGRWVCQPDEGPTMPVESAVRLLKAVFPGREVLVIACNEDGHALNVPGTWYAKQIVWAKPYLFAPHRTWLMAVPGSGAGAIEQFTRNGE